MNDFEDGSNASRVHMRNKMGIFKTLLFFPFLILIAICALHWFDEPSYVTDTGE